MFIFLISVISVPVFAFICTHLCACNALLAIAEMEFAARNLLDAVDRDSSTVVASHTLQRLTRTIV